MCPRYQVTREEKHSTRGRARLLFEMLDGHGDGPSSERLALRRGVEDALDLCLACKGCKSDCPVDVDMATYKAEFLAHYYEGQAPPARGLHDGLAARCAAQVIGRLRAGPAGQRSDRDAPGCPARRPGSPGSTRGAGPAASPAQTLQQWFAAARPRRRRARAARCCCGRTRSPTHLAPAHRPGRRGGARGRRLAGRDAAAAAVLRPDLDLHRPAGRRRSACCAARSTHWPSTCAQAASSSGWSPAAPRCSAPTCAELLPDDHDVAAARAARPSPSPSCSREHTRGWRPPRLDRTALAQTHCHQHAVLGFERRHGSCCATWASDAEQLDVGLLRAGRQLRLPARPPRGQPRLRRAGAPARAYGAPTRTRSSSPTASAAARRSSSSTAAGARRSTWPSC